MVGLSLSEARFCSCFASRFEVRKGPGVSGYSSQVLVERSLLIPHEVGLRPPQPPPTGLVLERAKLDSFVKLTAAKAVNENLGVLAVQQD